MASPYIGEIRIAGFNFAPVDWSFCNGALIPISQNEALYALIGTTYGGDGVNTFQLPNLQSRVPIHQGSYQGTPYVLGQQAGSETVTVTTNQLPSHNHPLVASNNTATSPNPGGNVEAASQSVNIYVPADANIVQMQSISDAAGGSQPHENMQPFLALNFIIALFGIFPSQG